MSLIKAFVLETYILRYVKSIDTGLEGQMDILFINEISFINLKLSVHLLMGRLIIHYPVNTTPLSDLIKQFFYPFTPRFFFISSFFSFPPPPRSLWDSDMKVALNRCREGGGWGGVDDDSATSPLHGAYLWSQH